MNKESEMVTGPWCTLMVAGIQVHGWTEASTDRENTSSRMGISLRGYGRKVSSMVPAPIVMPTPVLYFQISI